MGTAKVERCPHCANIGLLERRRMNHAQLYNLYVMSIKKPVIARMESGKTAPRLDTLLKLLAPLGKTLKIVDLADEL